MKTTRLSYSILTSREFIFRSQKYFLLSSLPPTAKMTSWLRHLKSFKLKLQMDLKNIETFKPCLKKPSVISHHLVVLIRHDSAELWWLVVRPSPNPNRPCSRTTPPRMPPRLPQPHNVYDIEYDIWYIAKHELLAPISYLTSSYTIPIKNFY
jgi:hypothetical protein